jgi:hypothetical protein
MYRGATRLSWGADKGASHSIDWVIVRAEPGISRGLYAEGKGGRVLSCAGSVAENIGGGCLAQARLCDMPNGFMRDIQPAPRPAAKLWLDSADKRRW